MKQCTKSVHQRTAKKNNIQKLWVMVESVRCANGDWELAMGSSFTLAFFYERHITGPGTTSVIRRWRRGAANNNRLKQAGNQEVNDVCRKKVEAKMYSVAQSITGWIKSNFRRVRLDLSPTWTVGWPLDPDRSRWNASSRASRSCQSSSRQCNAMWGCTSCQTPAGHTHNNN